MKTIQIEQIRTVLILAAAAYLVASAGWYIFGSPDISQSIVDWFQLNQGSRVYSKQDNISYADASDSRRKGDVYLPASSEPERPLLVVVHGGSWNQGSKADFEERVMARYFAEHGYVVFVPDYRLLSDGAKFPDNVSDIKKALAFAVNQKTWRVDPEKVFLLGSSSGTSAALLAAYTTNNHHNQFGIDFGKSPSVKAACSISGYNDMAAEPDNPYLKQYLNLSNTTADSKIFAAASPANYLDDAVPTIFVHGDADENVDYSQSQKLSRELEKHKIRTRLITVTGQGHFIGSASRRRCLDEVHNFFTRGDLNASF